MDEIDFSFELVPEPDAKVPETGTGSEHELELDTGIKTNEIEMLDLDLNTDIGSIKLEDNNPEGTESGSEENSYFNDDMMITIDSAMTAPSTTEADNGEATSSIATSESEQTANDNYFARTLSQAESKLKVYETLMKDVNSDRTVLNVLNDGLDLLIDIVGCDAGSIIQYDIEKGDLFFAVARGEKADDIMKFRLKVGQGIAGYTAEHLETIAVSDVLNDERFYKAISQSLGFETKSLIAIPMVVDGNMFGVIELLNKIATDDFTKDDMEMIDMVNGTMSTVIANKLSTDKYVKRVGDLVEVISLNEKISQIKDVNELVKELVTIVKQLTRAKAVEFITPTGDGKYKSFQFDAEKNGLAVTIRDSLDAFVKEMVASGQMKLHNILKNIHARTDDTIREQGSKIAMPLSVKNKIFGILEVRDKESGALLSYDDVKVVTAAAKIVTERVAMIFKGL